MATHLRTYRDSEVPRAAIAMGAGGRGDGGDGLRVGDHRHARMGGSALRWAARGSGRKGRWRRVLRGSATSAEGDRDVVLSGFVGGVRRQQRVHSGAHVGGHTMRPSSLVKPRGDAVLGEARETAERARMALGGASARGDAAKLQLRRAQRRI